MPAVAKYLGSLLVYTGLFVILMVAYFAVRDFGAGASIFRTGPARLWVAASAAGLMFSGFFLALLGDIARNLRVIARNTKVDS